MGSENGGWSEVFADDASVVVSTDRPFAVVRRPGAVDRPVSWPDLDIGSRAAWIMALGAPTGVWVLYRPMESDDPSFPSGTSAAVHVSTEGKLTRFVRLTEHVAHGATRHGVWLTSHEHADPEHDDQPGEHRVTVLGPDGSTRGFTIDRRLAFVIDEASSVRLVLHAGALITNHDGGGATYRYRYAAASVPDEVLAAATRIECLETVPFEVQELGDLPRVTRTDPPSDDVVEWDLVPLAEHHRDAAIRSVVREFAELAQYWRSEDGRMHPLTAGLADPEVEVVDAWPKTRVSVTFRHPVYPEGRLRRTLRVFDDAGRAIPALYAAIHLMEDLDTKVPDAAKARRGILEI